MTFAELLSTVEHTKALLDIESVAYHKVPVFCLTNGGKVDDLYPSRLQVADANAAEVLKIPVGTQYLEFETE